MTLSISVVGDLSEVEEADWNALDRDDNPFLEYAFLRGLEVTGCVGTPETGWIPHHMTIYDSEGLCAALPLYLKLDSYGEYIFDWSISNAAHRAGIQYYPKLVSAVPFSPVTGPRILLHPTRAPDNIFPIVGQALQELAKQTKSSSAHILFQTASEQKELAGTPLVPRASYQFHWRKAESWSTFDDFLQSLRSSNRKQLKKERRRAQSYGLQLELLYGEALDQKTWSKMHDFYRSTIHFKGAIPYLNGDFFEYIHEYLPHSLVMSVAKRDTTPIAGSFFLRSPRKLYGRYWGCLEHYEQLHFELCYYLPMEWAISQGITYFEAGAQGPHKLKRGFLATQCHSSHWIDHPGLAQAVYAFFKDESEDVERSLKGYNAHSPYKKT